MPKRVLIAWMLLWAALFAAPARADDISAASRSVVRVVVVAVQDGQVAGFGHGSGFAVGPNRIVTNAHVVQIALEHPKDVIIGVVPSEGSRSYEARIVNVDPARDLALLEFTGGTLPPVSLFSGTVPEGATVAALGYPGNVDLATAQSADDYINPLPPTRSMGNYSNIRAINGIQALLHTASIARGNSGGPLLDQCGRVIGVNTFITRGDDGDSPFAFAIANRELIAFLRASGQSVNAVAGECVAMADRLQQDRERSAEEERRAATAAASREREAREALEQQRREIEDVRANRFMVAIILIVLAAGSMGAGIVMLLKDRALPAGIGGGIGLLLLAAAAFLFFTRPGFDEVGETELGDAEKASPAAAFAGRHSCRLVPERSRVTVSPGENVELEWREGGCVNGRTQYADEGGSWTRILVPNDDQTVSVLEVRPGARQYVVNRYLLSAGQMSQARRLRQRIAIAACTSDEGQRTALAAAQEEIRRSLPELPNERLVYDCSDEGRGAS